MPKTLTTAKKAADRNFGAQLAAQFPYAIELTARCKARCIAAEVIGRSNFEGPTLSCIKEKITSE